MSERENNRSKKQQKKKKKKQAEKLIASYPERKATSWRGVLNMGETPEEI